MTPTENSHKPLKLSALDVQWPGHLGDLVPHLDELGYHRYWASEHHGPLQSASPTVMTALAAGLTDRMRVGTGAILMKFHNPLKVAEDFRLLELFYGGRLDLGVTSAVPDEPMRSALLGGRPLPDSAGYARKVEELTRLVRRQPTDKGDMNGKDIGPETSTPPEIWICGASLGSARLAARLGLAYAFHSFANHGADGKTDGPAIIDAYRSEFCSNTFLPAPQFNITTYGLCGADENRARAQWPMKGEPGFIGSAEQCRQQLLELRERFDAEELVVQSFANDFPNRLESYSLLAEAMGLKRAWSGSDLE